MTIGPVKYRRTMAQSAIGRCAASADAMLDYVPDTVIAALSSTQLGALLDAMWSACQEAKTLADRDAIAGGAIWDERKQMMREIAL